jgi:hypothetical protein
VERLSGGGSGGSRVRGSDDWVGCQQIQRLREQEWRRVWGRGGEQGGLGGEGPSRTGWRPVTKRWVVQRDQRVGSTWTIVASSRQVRGALVGH